MCGGGFVFGLGGGERRGWWEGERGERGEGHAGAGSGSGGFGDSTRGLEFSHSVCLSWDIVVCVF